MSEPLLGVLVNRGRVFSNLQPRPTKLPRERLSTECHTRTRLCAQREPRVQVCLATGQWDPDHATSSMWELSFLIVRK